MPQIKEQIVLRLVDGVVYHDDDERGWLPLNSDTPKGNCIVCDEPTCEGAIRMDESEVICGEHVRFVDPSD